ncbi:hypothetical protein [Vibrio phage vB_VpaS_CHI]|nr:hypothetical protein [Vibrio phage vB_VpaS_ALK]USL90102.1 hypothetical protein [Vibrio phage vB_VpaS_CHI]
MPKLYIIANNKIVATANNLSDADRYCGAKLANVATHVDECSLNGLEIFSDGELLQIVNNHSDHNYSHAKRDALIGLVLNIAKDIEPVQNTFAIPADKERVPYEIPRLSDAQRLAQLGDHTQAGKGTSTVTRSTTPTNSKRPKPGTASAQIWDTCDAILAKDGFDAVKEAVMVWGKASGINPSTVRTQYGHWRRFNNLG